MRAPASLLFILGLALLVLAASLVWAFHPAPEIARAKPLPYAGIPIESISKELEQKTNELQSHQEDPPSPRAPDSLRREGRTFIGGGLLILPPSFSPKDGRYDLVFHFHGNTELVFDGFASKQINAALVIMNLGTGSAVYERRFASPSAFTAMLGRIQADLEQRGLRGAQLNRIALSAWSAGYGAVHALLRQPALLKSIDAVLLADGLHAHLGAGKKPDLTSIKAFLRFAKLAYEHKKLFVIAHSEIPSGPTSAGARETTDALLNWLHIRRMPFSQAPPLPTFASARKAVADDLFMALEPETKAEMGSFIARGYLGTKEGHHIMHLVQMSETLVPDLIQWWSSKSSD